VRVTSKASELAEIRTSPVVVRGGDGSGIVLSYSLPAGLQAGEQPEEFPLSGPFMARRIKCLIRRPRALAAF